MEDFSSCIMLRCMEQPANNQVLILEDPGSVDPALINELERLGFRTESVHTKAEYLNQVGDYQTVLVVADILMKGTKALSLLLVSQKLRPSLPIVVLTEIPPGTPRAMAFSNAALDEPNYSLLDPSDIAGKLQARMDLLRKSEELERS